MFKTQFANQFIKYDIVKKGLFKLSSGLFSEHYLQCAKIFEHPKLAVEICSLLTQKINETFGREFFDIIVSPAMGGVIFGYEMARQLDIPNVFCERDANRSFILRRGFDIPQNAKILIVEDVVTTAKSSLEVYDILQKFNPQSIAEVCVFDRRPDGVELPYSLVSLEKLIIPTFDIDNIPNYLSNIEPIKPGSR